ncbi:MAG: hypothetical protein AAF558_00210 [Verrucomicrobiota bacterium]
MKHAIVIFFALLTTGLLTLLLIWLTPGHDDLISQKPQQKTKTLPAKSVWDRAIADVAHTRVIHPPQNRSQEVSEEYAEAVHQEVLQAENDQDLIFSTLIDYLNKFQIAPVGSNAEITQMLVNFQKTQGLRMDQKLKIHASGQLVDPWGKAYQFTRKSDRSIKLVSAGPDRTFGTLDDIMAENFDNRLDL